MPRVRQDLAAHQDLLNHDISVRSQTRAQRAAIAGGIGKTIDVIDAHAVDQALAMQAQDQRVRLLEDLLVFLAQADKVVDLEEAAEIDAIAGALPPRQA